MEAVVVGPQGFKEHLAPSGVKDREASGGLAFEQRSKEDLAKQGHTRAF